MARLARRRLLRGVGTATAFGLAGCLSGAGGGDGARYRLSADNVPGSLADHLRWEPYGPFADTRRAAMDRLVADGTLTTTGFALRPPGPDAARYVERDGTYYRFSIERLGEVERDRWIFWFDLIEGSPPDGAEVFRSGLGAGGGTNLAATYGLSELDVRVVEDAAGEVVREGGVHELEGVPAGRRGHVFLRRDADGTALLPEPPFTHVAFETDAGTRYARAVTERVPVELRQYEHTTTRIAASRADYVAHVRDEHLEASFARADLTDAEREILETITRGGGRHEERTPLSEAMTAVLERLDLGDVETPAPDGIAFSDAAYFRYTDGYFGAELQIFR